MYKPVILIGNGCRHNPALVKHLCSLGIPVLTTWMAIDLVAEDNPAFCGRPGIFGQRAANIIQQKATHLYCFGARLDGEQVAYDYQRFAQRARVIVYDIDRAELDKLPVHWERGLYDLADFTWNTNLPVDPAWLSWCKDLYARFRPELDGTNSGTKYIHPFAFMAALSDACKPDDMLAIGSSGGAPVAFLQSFKVKAGQRIINLSTIGAMGADIPMAIGAAIASGRRTICVTGDGGFMLNTQELETARRLQLPITYFVFNNNGYNSIRTMQDARFDGRRVGADPKSGLTLPDLDMIADAYRLNYSKLACLDNLERHIADGIARIVEVPIDPAYRQTPRVMASTVNGQLRTDDMQDMTPKLEPEELEALMEWGD